MSLLLRLIRQICGGEQVQVLLRRQCKQETGAGVMVVFALPRADAELFLICLQDS